MTQSQPMSVDDSLEAARARWPNLSISREAFAKYIDSTEIDLSELVCERQAELSLAFACANGDDTALAMFERDFLPTVYAALSKLGCGPEEKQEIAQKVRTTLLTGDAPRILRFSGRGSLKRWLWVLTVRKALRDLKKIRGEAAKRDAGSLSDVATLSADPELEYLRKMYRQYFSLAFGTALNSLNEEQRNLLWFHFVEGLNIDQIGLILQVHRSTAARKLKRVRKTLLDRTRQAFAEHLDLSAADMDSILRLVQSNLDISIRGALLPAVAEA